LLSVLSKKKVVVIHTSNVLISRDVNKYYIYIYISVAIF
jgi:hypothetical protein